jgi:hypothetical protein
MHLQTIREGTRSIRREARGGANGCVHTTTLRPIYDTIMDDGQIYFLEKLGLY